MNLSSLALGRGQNLRVHNLVSLANVQGNQCIALPISLMMTSPNNQQNLNSVANGNVVLSLQDTSKHQIITDQNSTTPNQNVVLINNIDHNTNQPTITYQPHQTAQFSIGNATLGGLNCRLTNTDHQQVVDSNQMNQHYTTTNFNQHSIVNPIVNSTNLPTNHQGPIAIHLSTCPTNQLTEK